jgi:hypothetical protein
MGEAPPKESTTKGNSPASDPYAISFTGDRPPTPSESLDMATTLKAKSVKIDVRLAHGGQSQEVFQNPEVSFLFGLTAPAPAV